MTSFTTTLNAMDLLEVSGEDSGKFLQGQLTCDVDKLPVGHCGLGATCNTKGRVYASFRVYHLNDRFYLTMQTGLRQLAQPVLQKYIPFYKASMADGSKRFSRIAVAGDEAVNLLQEVLPEMPAPNTSVVVGNTTLFNVSTSIPRFELWFDPAQDNPLASIASALAPAGIDNWLEADMDAGICLLQPQDSELYTPEELNMDLAGFVSFSKGCYTGQEIVARMHYRGKARKRLFLVQAQTDSTASEGLLVNEAENTLGKVFNLLYLNKNITKGFVILKADTDPQEAYWLKQDGNRVPATLAALGA